jgi:hypothetical protein
MSGYLRVFFTVSGRRKRSAKYPMVGWVSAPHAATNRDKARDAVMVRMRMIGDNALETL